MVKKKTGKVNFASCRTFNAVNYQLGKILLFFLYSFLLASVFPPTEWLYGDRIAACGHSASLTTVGSGLADGTTVRVVGARRMSVMQMEPGGTQHHQRKKPVQTLLM